MRVKKLEVIKFSVAVLATLLLLIAINNTYMRETYTLPKNIYAHLYYEENNHSHPLVYVGSPWTPAPSDVSTMPSICLATHTTVDHLFWLAYHASSWEGLISVAIYAPGSDEFVAQAMIKYLRVCHPDLESKTAFHLVAPYFAKDRNLKKKIVNFPKFNCTKLEAEKLNKLYLKVFNKRDTKSLVSYPQNVMRNLARKHCPTTYTMTVDIDMISSKSLAVHLRKFLDSKKLCLKCAYVIPVYEVSKNVSFPPEDKATLMRLLERKFARRFHETVYAPNQRSSQLGIWEYVPLTHSSTVSILYETRIYEDGWEPIVVLHQSAPEFDKRFVGYGRTRSSQIFLLHHLKYVFFVLENAFLAHRGLQTAKHYPDYRLDQIQENEARFQTFQTEVYQKYGTPEPVYEEHD